jgi:hypothetical protein
MFKKVLSNFSKTKPQYLNFKFQNYSKTQKQIEKGYLSIYFLIQKDFPTSVFHKQPKKLNQEEEGKV